MDATVVFYTISAASGEAAARVRAVLRHAVDRK
jgi:hypothetical protein